MPKNLYQSLMKKSIYAILDGDTKYEEYKFDDDNTNIPISMPYLKGGDLCDISRYFKVENMPFNGASRWQYVENILNHCIENNKISDFFVYLFEKKNFINMFQGHNHKEIDKAHDHFIKTIIKKINEILYFDDCELIALNKKQYIIKELSSNIDIDIPKIKIIGREYIKSISARAINEIEQKNYDSAITKARTILEEVFCYVIEKKNEKPSDKGNINLLLKQVKELYNMHTDEKTDSRIKGLLSGLGNIVSSIAEMRNKNSDAHGVGASRIRIDEHHARLFVNSAIMMADFILSVEQKANKK